MATKRTNNILKFFNNPKVSEKEKVALSLTETYGKLLTNGGMADGKELEEVMNNRNYSYAKTFLENHYRSLDNAIILELAIMLAISKEVRAKFVPSKTHFVDMELDYVPNDKKDESVYSLSKFGEKGEKVFEKVYTEQEAVRVKADRKAKQEALLNDNLPERN